MPTTVAMTQYTATAVLNKLLNNTGTPPGVTSGLYLWLLKTAPTSDVDVGTGVTFISTTYTKPQVPFTVGPASPAADFQRAFNTALISITMSGTTDTAVGIALCTNGSTTPTAADFLTGATSNPVFFYGTFTSSITLNATDVLQFAAGGAGGGSGITIDLF
jgi:hypothetical protein